MSKLSRRRFVTAAGASLFAAAVNPVRPVYAAEIPSDGRVVGRLDLRRQEGELVADAYATNIGAEGIMFDERAVLFVLELVHTDGTRSNVTYMLEFDPDDLDALTARIVRPSFVSLAPNIEMHVGTLRPIIPVDAPADALLAGTMTLHLNSSDTMAVAFPATVIPPV